MIHSIKADPVKVLAIVPYVEIKSDGTAFHSSWWTDKAASLFLGDPVTLGREITRAEGKWFQKATNTILPFQGFEIKSPILDQTGQVAFLATSEKLTRLFIHDKNLAP